MTKSGAIEVFGIHVKPGEFARERVRVAEFADGAPMTMPLTIVNGRRPGPTLYLQAGIHGDEVTGTEVAVRLTSQISPDQLAGVLITAPIANVPGYLTRSRTFALEERAGLNMHGVFPGAETFLTDRIAKKLHDEILVKTQYAIDMHTGLTGASCYPFSYVCPTDNQDGLLKTREEIALACSTSGVVFYLSREDCRKFRSIENYDATFFEVAHRQGIATTLWEMGEGGRITREFVDPGVEGIRNVMKHLGMLEGELVRPQETYKFTKLAVAFAPAGGLLQVKARLGGKVRQGDLVGEILDPLGKITPVHAPRDGLVLRVMTQAIVYPGAEVVWVAY